MLFGFLQPTMNSNVHCCISKALHIVIIFNMTILENKALNSDGLHAPVNRNITSNNFVWLKGKSAIIQAYK